MTQIANIVKGINWIDHVVNMEPGDEKPFPLDKANTIRNAVSGKVRLLYPERQYETLSDKNAGTLVLRRIR